MAAFAIDVRPEKSVIMTTKRSPFSDPINGRKYRDTRRPDRSSQMHRAGIVPKKDMTVF